MLTNEQINFVLKDILELYGHDFNFYSRESFDRRINRIYKLEKFSSYEAFSLKIRSDKNYIHHFIDRITVNVTEMFRDPAFFNCLRTEVIPQLAKQPHIRIWHAGCSTGEEAFSIAILMYEAGLLHKTEIIATDINEHVLTKARNSVYSAFLMENYERNYLEAGGKTKLNLYFDKVPEGQKIKSEISASIKFQQHNLATGEMTGKFDLIVCRNVLIYFDRSALRKVFDVFNDSTGPFSYLGLGEKETLQFSHIDSKFSRVGKERVWKKI